MSVKYSVTLLVDALKNVHSITHNRSIDYSLVEIMRTEAEHFNKVTPPKKITQHKIIV